MSRNASGRYAALDSLRGICVLSMILYHAMYDYVAVLGHDVPWFFAPPGYFWQQSICWTFIFLSGFCWGFSRNHWKQGLVLTGCGCVVTLVTYFAMPSELIRWGVLTLLGLSTLLLACFHLLAERMKLRCPAWAGLLLSALLFFLTKQVPLGFLGFGSLLLCPLPSALYSTPFLAVLGLPGPGFTSSDYFPLVPWFFLFLAGHFLWKLVREKEALMEKLRPSLRPLAFIGRHSLLIYLLHQPLLFGLFSLVQMIF